MTSIRGFVLRRQLKASVDRPDEVQLYGCIRDTATALDTIAERIRNCSLRGQTPSLKMLADAVTILRLADQAALAFIASHEPDQC